MKFVSFISGFAASELVKRHRRYYKFYRRGPRARTLRDIHSSTLNPDYTSGVTNCTYHIINFNHFNYLSHVIKHLLLLLLASVVR